MVKIILRLLFLPLLAMALGACADEFEFGRVPGGEGSANIRATVTFTPLVTRTLGASSDSRAAGDALQALNNLTIFFYSPNGQDAQGNTIYSLVKIASGDDLLNYNADKTNTQTPADPNKKAEATTMEATFNLADIPYGNYHIYALANAGSFDDTEATREQFATEDKLKEYSVTWNSENILDNAQMFGYFSTDSYVDATSGKYEIDSFDAPTVTIDSSNITLYAWVARAASKVTIAFDGSGLENDIWIYIKSVTIHDIPRTCPVGAPNTPSSNDELIADGETLNYNQDGVITDGSAQSESYDQWLEISKGSGVKGIAVTTDTEGKVTGHDDETAPALYFYENLQGNFQGRPDEALFDKAMNPDSVGTNVWEAGQPGYKDNVPYGTYIEVEAYYVSHNTRDLTRGRIIYRYMLGQNDTYDYNASRNRHYQLTLGFRGFANQPDWHINYYEPPIAMYFDAPYHISYIYNHKATFPIRIVGDVTELEVEIVENNWAPFDSVTTQGAASYMHIPKASFGEEVTDFKWARQVYVNDGKRNTTNVSGSNYNNITTTTVTNQGYYYGLQRPYSSDGSTRLASGYDKKEIDRGAPEYVTPIWAGFLALQVQDTDLPAVENAVLNGHTYAQNLYELRDQYYNRKQNIRVFSESDLHFDEGQTSKVVGNGNNACVINKAADGSITIMLPMWTRPKSFWGISGFTGNNPYDTYQRRAIVRVTAKYEKIETPSKITHYVPVYQVRRIVNPKAIWRAWNDDSQFHVTLTQRPDAESGTDFKEFNSSGFWKAYIRKGDFFSLSGGMAMVGDTVIGDTTTPIDFDVKFNGKLGSAADVKCGIIEVEYNGLTCNHTIFVRQGYNEPLDVAGDGVKWSSFQLYSCENTPFGTQWDEQSLNYINAELTKNPLSLGSLFKRGNYNGILLGNNIRPNLGLQSTTMTINSTFEMADGTLMKWKDIQGYPYVTYTGGKYQQYESDKIQSYYSWGRFQADVNNEHRHYRVPTQAEYQSLQKNCEFGIGVMYGDDATTTALSLTDAYGFIDYDNDGLDDTHKGNGTATGTRGMIVYNTDNGSQIFFPVGALGVGRRTIQSATGVDTYGQLRYSSVLSPLGLLGANSGRPIPNNMPAAPGAAWWYNQCVGDNMSWEVNYFDMNFEALDYGTGYTTGYSASQVGVSGTAALTQYNQTHGGDALPIRLVLDEEHPH